MAIADRFDCRNTMLAGCTGSFASLLYMWIRFGKPDASMAGTDCLRPVAITLQRLRDTVGAAIIGFSAGNASVPEC